MSSQKQLADPIKSASITEWRRDFHQHAEPGWCEIRTASKIARKLSDLRYDLHVGREVVAESRAGLPPAEELADAYARAIAQGADSQFARDVAGGFTGVVGILRGSRPGPVVALRFDIDANYGTESDSPLHRAAAGGYRSINQGVHHSCGHDAHAAIGMAVAQSLAHQRERLVGEVRLIFQPAEEGLRGGAAMVAAGVVDGVDHVLGCHIGAQARQTGEIIAGYRNLLASHKFDVHFMGRNAHAGISPHCGRNAIQAAAIAVQNLLAISRHGDGETRVNVGKVSGGQTRNAIPATAMLCAEIRADNNPILDFLKDRAEAVIAGAGQMCGVDYRIEYVGGAEAASSDDELTEIVSQVAERTQDVNFVRRTADFKASDDMSSFINQVQHDGGTAVYFGLGTGLSDVHHAPSFDIDDSSLVIGRDVFMGCLQSLGALE